jgi:hypothetical protein
VVVHGAPHHYEGHEDKQDGLAPGEREV